MNPLHAMNHRAMSLALACLTALAAQAQGLRPSGAAGLPRLPSAATLLPPAGSPGAQLRQADYIVAVVNSEPITNNEVRQRAERVTQQLRSQGATVPPHELLLKEVLERLILEKIQVQQAKEAGIKVDDYAINQAEQNVARQNDVSVEEMHQRLTADGISAQRFREDLRNQLLALRVREREVEARVRVSDLEVDQYLQDQQKTAGPGKMELNLGHILVKVAENAGPEEVAKRAERAQTVRDKLRDGAEFGVLVQEYSDAPEGAGGGLLGLRPADRYPELFVNAVRQAAVGSIVGPLRSPAGFHILKVVDRTQGGAPTMAVQNHARHILLRVGAGLSERQVAERLEDLRQRVLRGQADFATLAREYSQDGSAKEGGDLGWAGPGRYVPEFQEALNALRPGEISQPVVSRFGVHLIQLLERREAKLTQREQRDMVRDQVREKKLDEAFTTWIQEARGRTYVEYREPPQ
ncbi:MAG: peptidylprolyl isomerase [Proteobacteria bacterium]|nr:peptidylprolyl isomerase [Pseudomonadota bacterium]